MHGTKTDKLLSAYRLALLDPESGNIAAQMINHHYLETGDYNGLIKEWAACTRIPGSGCLPWINLGYAHILTGNLSEATDIFISILKENPGEPRAHFYLGAVKLGQYDNHAGISHIADSVCLKPVLASSAANLVAAFAATAWEDGLHLDAEFLFHAASNIEPSNLWHQVRLAELWEQMGKEEEAVALYLQILNIAPESPYTARNLDAY